ncbi:hypothetical protein WJX77_008137 [Trebouxia sp. C0004]
MHAGYPGQYTDTRASVDCKYFLEGRCSLGDACPFRHRAELFNTAARARAALAPHSQPIVCHFYLNGKCTKGASCAFQHPQPAAQAAAPRPAVQPQEEMQIDFEDDESPRQTEPTRSAKPVAPRQPPVQARLGPKPQHTQSGSRRGEEQAAPQQVQNRLGGQPGVHRRIDSPPIAHRRQSTSADQDDTEKAKGSVFQRLSMSRPGTPLKRLTPLAVPADTKPPPRPTARPTDARELLVQTMTAKARVGRKEAEMARPRAVLPELATRRVVAVNRGAKGTPTPGPVHAPKFASPTSKSTGARKSALERIQLPQQNGTAAASSTRIPVSNPVTAAKPRRASVVPFTSSRMKPNASSSESPAQNPAQGETPSVTPAAGPSAGPGPSSEQSSAGTDRRGRPKITWQPPTASQKESDAQEARANLSKRKASDAACPALGTAAAAAAAGDELSPSKRIKAQAAPTDKQATSAPKSVAQPALQPPVQQPDANTAAAAAASEGQQQIDILEELQDVDSILDEGEAQLDYADQANLLDEAADDDVLFEDDFDDEATMRELEALG